MANRQSINSNSSLSKSSATRLYIFFRSRNDRRLSILVSCFIKHSRSVQLSNHSKIKSSRKWLDFFFTRNGVREGDDNDSSKFSCEYLKQPNELFESLPVTTVMSIGRYYLTNRVGLNQSKKILGNVRFPLHNCLANVHCWMDKSLTNCLSFW
jgi:hypothetical protein